MLNPRKLALDIIYDITYNGAYSNIAIEKAFKQSEVSEENKNLIRELVYGTIENDIYLNWVVQSYSKVKLKKISDQVLVLLKMSIYQLLFLDKIPDYSVCDEANKIALKIANIGAKKFVNGMLRTIIREKENLELKIEALKENAYQEYLSVYFSMPQWIVDRWIAQYGLRETELLLAHLQGKPKFCVRTNTLKIDRPALLKTLEEQGIEASPCQYAIDGIEVKNPVKMTDLEAFKKGYYIIQDESSMLVGQVLNPLADERILDVCSAPGGKTTHLAQKMKNSGQIIARDIYQHKIDLINHNCKRLGVKNVHAEVKDSLEVIEAEVGVYDKVLLDAPCSGMGIIKRKPEIKFNRQSEELKDIIELQKKLIESAYKHLKVGGIMVYSTCSIDKDENINQIMAYVSSGYFDLVAFDDLLAIEGAEKGYIQILPHTHQMDGFFIAKLVKKEVVK